MGAPRFHHGIRRGFNEFFSVFVLAVIIKILSQIMPDPKLSSYLNLAFWIIVIISTLDLILKLDYWNIGYTIGFIIAGLLIVYAFRQLISPFDILIYIGAIFYLIRKIDNKMSRRRYYRWT